MSHEIALLREIRDLLSPRPDIEQTYLISSSQPYVLDRKNRKYAYLYTSNVLVLTIEDLGIITLPTNEWSDISFKQGFRIFATNQATSVPIFVKCTDQEIDLSHQGGSIPYHNITGASTNFTNVKTTATQCFGCNLSNTSGSAIFVKLYDKAITPGTGDTPKQTIQVPANSTVIRAYPAGILFTFGFGWSATGGVADNDNTNIAANCVIDFDLNS